MSTIRPSMSSVMTIESTMPSRLDLISWASSSFSSALMRATEALSRWAMVSAKVTSSAENCAARGYRRPARRTAWRSRARDRQGTERPPTAEKVVAESGLIAKIGGGGHVARFQRKGRHGIGVGHGTTVLLGRVPRPSSPRAATRQSPRSSGLHRHRQAAHGAPRPPVPRRPARAPCNGGWALVRRPKASTACCCKAVAPAVTRLWARPLRKSFPRKNSSSRIAALHFASCWITFAPAGCEPSPSGRTETRKKF